MYNEPYEEYMRNIFGYPLDYRNTYEMDNTMYNGYMQYNNTMQNNNEELEDCYPEIYKVVYPMVKKACMTNTKPVTKELIDDMVVEIHSAFEQQSEVTNVNINVGNNGNNVRSVDTKNSRIDTKVENKAESKENREKEDRGNNFLMNDLIRILILRELLNNNRPPAPPRPMPPNRPPFHNNRPPMMPRGFESDYLMY